MSSLVDAFFWGATLVVGGMLAGIIGLLAVILYYSYLEREDEQDPDE